MLRIQLIRPNAALRSTYLPIGLGYIAAAARAAGHRVRILDARLERLEMAETMARIREFAPDVLGLTAVHEAAEKKAVLALAERFKKTGGRAPIVLGGPLVSTSGAAMVASGLIEAAFLGEGEETFVRYLHILESGGDPAEVPGIFYARDGCVRQTPTAPLVEDVDHLRVAWDLLQPQRYFTLSGRSSQSIIKRSHRCVPLFTSRGCPFGCIYCHNIFGRRFRPRTPEAVVAEMALLADEYGAEEIEIEDDCFNLDLDRAKAIARLIIARRLKLHLSFPTGLRADRMDRELVDLLKAAGTYRIFYAVETAVPRLQRLIRKNIDFDRAGRMIAYTAASGIMTCGFFMQGFPTETAAEMEQTIAYALGSQFHQAFFFYVNPFPGTELAERYAVREALDPDPDRLDYFSLKVNLSDVPAAVIQRLHRLAYRRFYLSPRRLIRLARVVPKNRRTLWAAIIAILLGFRELDDF